MMRDEEIKLKVATIIDETVGEKKKSRQRQWVWAGSACAAIMITSIAFALYLNNFPPELSVDALRGKITKPPLGPRPTEVTSSMVRVIYGCPGYTVNKF